MVNRRGRNIFNGLERVPFLGKIQSINPVESKGKKSQQFQGDRRIAISRPERGCHNFCTFRGRKTRNNSGAPPLTKPPLTPNPPGKAPLASPAPEEGDIAASSSAGGRQPKFGIATGLSHDGDKAAVGGEASAPGLAACPIGKQIISICPRSRRALNFFRPNSTGCRGRRLVLRERRRRLFPVQ